MSGGVDSSVTAYLLKEGGYNVEGVSFILWEARSRVDPRSCCSLQAIESARETSEIIGIPHRAVDVRGEFMDKVIDPFVEDYLKGVTPNPCVLCNLHIKFPFLLNEAERAGVGFIATGHYARVEGADGRHLLKKGLDPGKDQSYFLYVLNQNTLNRLLLPLGVYTKKAVREIAAGAGLPAMRRPESVEICFIEEDYCSFIRNLIPGASRPGPVIGPDGDVIGTHQGIYNFTVGQRRGLNISYREPLYVIRIDPDSNTVYTGTREIAMRREVTVRALNWISGPIERVTAKIRSMMRDEPATMSVEEGGSIVRLLFDAPQWAPAPGQSAVFYDGDVVIGGGVIVSGDDLT